MNKDKLVDASKRETSQQNILRYVYQGRKRTFSLNGTHYRIGTSSILCDAYWTHYFALSVFKIDFPHSTEWKSSV